ncbi:MAG: hypothetical protein CM15mP74_00610 [Halieaceae bacterium]|nr:MAG: hypothetical protein CM15mP74_00610 [Halieaceae bacterium]
MSGESVSFARPPAASGVQRGATDAVAVTAQVILAPVDGWNRLVQSFQSRAALQDEVFGYSKKIEY